AFERVKTEPARGAGEPSQEASVQRNTAHYSQVWFCSNHRTQEQLPVVENQHCLVRGKHSWWLGEARDSSRSGRVQNFGPVAAPSDNFDVRKARRDQANGLQLYPSCVAWPG